MLPASGLQDWVGEMLLNDESWLALSDTFYTAALQPEGWHSALEGLAAATGSAVGELIGLGANAAIPFNIVTNLDPAFNQEFLAAGGGDPTINPRVNAGMNAPVLKVLAEADFITPEDYRRNPHYQEFAIPWDIPFICLSTLERSDEMLIGLAVARTREQGHITSEQREIFASLAPHVRAAVRMQIALEGQGSNLLIGAMEALSMPAFVCDRSGQVCALTPAAERLLHGNRGLQLRQGNLRAMNARDDSVLGAAIKRAVRGLAVRDEPLQSTIVIRNAANLPSLVLDVVSLPSRPFEFGFAPRVLVLARGERDVMARRAAILCAAYALTNAETDIALHVAAGKTTEEIATLRGVAIGTVRLQIKTVLGKLGVKRQVELAARLAQL